MKKLLATLAFVAAVLPSFAQKPALDHSVYDGWKSVANPEIPDAGEWAVYRVVPQQGDAVLHLYNVKTGKEYTVDRASKPVISQDASKAVFKIAPLYEQTRQARIKKKKGDKMPKDTLGVIDLKTGEITKYDKLKNFKTSELLRDLVAFQKNSKDNDTMYVLNIRTGKVDSIAAVQTFTFAQKSEALAYITKPGKKDSVTVRGIYKYDPATGSGQPLLTGEKKAVFTGMNFSEEGDRLVFFASLDTVKDAAKRLDMYICRQGETKMLLAHDSPDMPEGWKLGEKSRVVFHDDCLTFGIMPVPREKDTTLVEFEQARLDIWRWNDDYIQPVQNVRAAREKERTYMSKLNYDGTGFVKLADESIQNVGFEKENRQEYVLAMDDKPYRMQRAWNTDACYDIYLISLKDGSRRLLEKGAAFSRSYASPDGAWYALYNEKDRNWYQYSVADDQWKELTSGLGVAFYDEEDDHPGLPGAYDGAYWSEDSKYFLIRDRFDYWQIDPTGKTAPKLFTEGRGRGNNTAYSLAFPVSRSAEPSYKRRAVATAGPVYFYTFNHTTKQTGVARKDLSRKNARIEQLVEGPYRYDNLAISEGKKPVMIYTRGNFEDGTNLWMTKDSFKNQTQLSDVNPQQRDYNWGTVELVNWTAADGTFAEGLLYKPENFDPDKKYPVIVYFYERNSENLYASRAPAPSASTVNIPFFVSNEYIVFVPDIRYKDGHPGKCCMDYIMTGCDMLCEYPWIDGDNMAVQGQSWGGYQVAYIITHTTRFKAAGAGAPVSNMTSAYGGIRWGSGVARTMQYEKGQSRIGKDLWEGFDLYVENSPLFFVPNVTTPVLIMHNDKDDAVPWWQGIEFFNGLRRCGKQAWMLQYNDETHNLSERRNRKDLSRRLDQFFGHFLKGEPMPKWMSEGIPATLKGIDYGFETEQK